jgi:ankyrin repeat protein
MHVNTEISTHRHTHIHTHTHIGNGMLTTVQGLIESGVDTAQTEFSPRQLGRYEQQTGRSALLLTAAGGHLATVQWLLFEGGASISEVDVRGRTALLLAAENGMLATLQWLLSPERGVSICACECECE